MTDFIETRFPTDISGGASGGPKWLTDKVPLRSGHEEINSVWQHPLRDWDAAYGLKTLDDLHRVLAFWMAVGLTKGFRWRDRTDWKSCLPGETPKATDQTIGTGDGGQVQFSLRKAYTAGSASYTRPIVKAVAGSVKIAVAGTATTAFTVNNDSGIVALSAAPPSGAAVTAGYEFDVPVRFMDDKLEEQIELYHAGQASIRIKEIRL